ncbi:hypothetical protein [Luteococcus sp.]|uniref:hypothetical protein n=1 Tax=Luteococcus sp. TaxID=1969402 RepID=UPI003736A5D5
MATLPRRQYIAHAAGLVAADCLLQSLMVPLDDWRSAIDLVWIAQPILQATLFVDALLLIAASRDKVSRSRAQAQVTAMQTREQNQRRGRPAGCCTTTCCTPCTGWGASRARAPLQRPSRTAGWPSLACRPGAASNCCGGSRTCSRPGCGSPSKVVRRPPCPTPWPPPWPRRCTASPGPWPAGAPQPSRRSWCCPATAGYGWSSTAPAARRPTWCRPAARPRRCSTKWAGHSPTTAPAWCPSGRGATPARATAWHASPDDRTRRALLHAVWPGLVTALSTAVLAGTHLDETRSLLPLGLLCAAVGFHGTLRMVQGPLSRLLVAVLVFLSVVAWGWNLALAPRRHP